MDDDMVWPGPENAVVVIWSSPYLSIQSDA